MLIIRPAQMKAFAEAALRQFEQHMVVHFKKFAARHCEAIGERLLRQAIRLGVERGAEYGFTNRGPVQFYCELMFMYGSDFDIDPQYPWAAATLKDSTFTDQMAKAVSLYAAAMEYTDIVAGPNYTYTKEAARRMRRIEYEQLIQYGPHFEDDMLVQIDGIYPQKVEWFGERKTRQLIAYGQTLPDKLSLNSRRGAAFCVVAMFALGHGFGHDPLFPWIARTLNNPAITDGTSKVKRLHSRMMTYLDQVIANQDAGR